MNRSHDPSIGELQNQKKEPPQGTEVVRYILRVTANWPFLRFLQRQIPEVLCYSLLVYDLLMRALQ